MTKHDFATLHPNDPPNGWLLDSGIHAGRRITLLTPDELRALAPDTPLVAIDGEIVLAGDADDDTRGGKTAFGRVPS